MVGDITVQEGGATAESTAVPIPDVPESAKSIAIALATVMSTALLLAFFFLKYGGEDGVEG